MLPTCPGEVLELTPNHLPFPHISFHFFSFPPIFLAFASIFYIFLFFHVFKYFQVFFRIKKYFSIEDENGAKVFFSYTPIDLVSVTAESCPEAPLGGFRAGLRLYYPVATPPYEGGFTSGACVAAAESV